MCIRDRTPVESYESRMGAIEECTVVLWHGDAGYDTGDATALGGRHRLVLAHAGWRLEKST